MSTFDGWLPDFPHIRIDQFRPLKGRPPPLACFLSHVHSDHLIGLESFRTPFIYCSSATRALVLRLEKYPHRMNFAKGVLECRKQTYKHLSKVLRPLPLDTPTTIQLAPGVDLRVTLLDANHCLGAVMFLIEGQGRAILYTGDIRAESWWTNALVRHPNLIKYTSATCRLDKIYLDTTFATKSDPYRSFPSKAEGMRELLHKLATCSKDGMFYFHAWTFGYEDVWRTLSNVLDSQIHLDPYRHGIYTSIAETGGRGIPDPQAPSLCGFTNSNERQPGILTSNDAVRIHSCERGTGCHVFDNNDKSIIDIMPIISRHQGVEMRELGAGGGNGDLNQNHELDLSMLNAEQVVALCAGTTKDATLLNRISELVRAALSSDDQRIKLDAFNEFVLPEDEEEAISLKRVPEILASLSLKYRKSDDAIVASKKAKSASTNSITFPYSRHSSYGELLEFVAAFRPRDVFPCTAPSADDWTEELSMMNLFAEVCDEDAIFTYDIAMRQHQAERRSLKRKHDAMESQDSGRRHSPVHAQSQSQEDAGSETSSEDKFESLREPVISAYPTDHEALASDAASGNPSPPGYNRDRAARDADGSSTRTPLSVRHVPQEQDLPSRALMQQFREDASNEASNPQAVDIRTPTKKEAYEAALGGTWDEVVQLSSTAARRET